MEASLKKVKENIYELLVELGREELGEYLENAEKQIARGVQIDGFRKGKVPRNKIRTHVGDAYILEAALNVAIHDSLSKTIQEKKLEVLRISDPDIKENNNSKLIYKVNLALFPEIKLGDISNLQVKRREVLVDRKEVEDALEVVQVSRSKLNPTEAPIKRGDRVEVDFEVTLDGQPVEGGVSKNHPLIVGDHKFIPGFEDNLVGMRSGEERRFSLTAPSDYVHKLLAGKKLDFYIKVANVQKVEKPVLTDEFARSLGQFNSLKDLEENIQRGIFEEKRLKERQRVRLDALAQIAKQSRVEVPKNMIEERLDDMITGFDQELHQKGMELSLHLSHINKTADDLKKDWLPEAEKQVVFSLILKKIAKDKNIVPSEEAIEEAANKRIQELAAQGRLDQENFDVGELKDAIKNELTNEKTLVFIEKTLFKTR